MKKSESNFEETQLILTMLDSQNNVETDLVWLPADHSNLCNPWYGCIQLPSFKQQLRSMSSSKMVQGRGNRILKESHLHFQICIGSQFAANHSPMTATIININYSCSSTWGIFIQFNPPFHSIQSSESFNSIPFFIQFNPPFHSIQSSFSTNSILLFIQFNPPCHSIQSSMSLKSILLFNQFNPLFHSIQSSISFNSILLFNQFNPPFHSIQSSVSFNSILLFIQYIMFFQEKYPTVFSTMQTQSVLAYMEAYHMKPSTKSRKKPAKHNTKRKLETSLLSCHKMTGQLAINTNSQKLGSNLIRGWIQILLA